MILRKGDIQWEKRNLTITSTHHQNEVQEMMRGKTMMFLGHDTEEYIHEFVNKALTIIYRGKCKWDDIIT